MYFSKHFWELLWHLDSSRAQLGRSNKEMEMKILLDVASKSGGHLIDGQYLHVGHC
jgi:hypothetical protein